jgi:ribonuclease PH
MPQLLRPDGRRADALRPFTFQWDVAPRATGSILVSCGATQVICAATIEPGVPRWKKAQNVPGGWLTAEYSMLPYSTHERKARDISKGKIDGRSQEIQRLIGRALRAVVDLDALGEHTLWVDCDVLAADGGTRTTAITGAALATRLAFERLRRTGKIQTSPLRESVAATSIGVVHGRVLLDLCYEEDRDAAADMNVVMTASGGLVEVQASGEEATFSPAQFQKMLKVATQGIRALATWQEAAWRKRPKA